MRLTFLGVSSALASGVNAFNSNMLLTSSNGNNLLLDCGNDIKHSLAALNLSQDNINAVYVSHLHSDHVGGLEWLGFAKRFLDKQKPHLYLHEQLVEPLWENVLRGGMQSIESRSANLETFFVVHSIKRKQFTWQGVQFHLVPVRHSMDNGVALPCFGLMLNLVKQRVFITTDTRFDTNLEDLYHKADIIFQDCETCAFVSQQHARYEDLVTLPPAIKSKMWLYDYNDNCLPNAKKDGFLGFVERGQSFTFD